MHIIHVNSSFIFGFGPEIAYCTHLQLHKKISSNLCIEVFSGSISTKDCVCLSVALNVILKTKSDIIQGPDLQNILRQSYDNAKVTVDLRWTSNLQNILRRT